MELPLNVIFITYAVNSLPKKNARLPEHFILNQSNKIMIF